MLKRKRVIVTVHGEYVVSLLGDKDGTTKRTARAAVMKLLGLKNKDEVSITTEKPLQDKVGEGPMVVIRIDDTPVL